MPIETSLAVEWAIAQGSQEEWQMLDNVRQYFNDNIIVYDTFSYDDLVPYL